MAARGISADLRKQFAFNLHGFAGHFFEFLEQIFAVFAGDQSVDGFANLRVTFYVFAFAGFGHFDNTRGFDGFEGFFRLQLVWQLLRQRPVSAELHRLRERRQERSFFSAQADTKTENHEILRGKTKKFSHCYESP